MAFSPDQALDLLLAAREHSRLPHAILLVSPDEAQAESVIARLVPVLNGNQPTQPLVEYEGSHTHIISPVSKSRQIRAQDIREKEDFIHLVTPPGVWKVLVVHEADRMNEVASNVFLKTLEEPPPWTLIILVTSQPEKLLRTIISRCVRISLLSPGVLPELTEAQKEFSPVLTEVLPHLENFAYGYLLARRFQEFLDSYRERIAKEIEVHIKEVSGEIAERSGVNNWAKEQEDSALARISSENILLRNELLDLMISWFGDAIRLASGAAYSLYPDCELPIRKLAQRPVLDLLWRLDILSRMRFDLNTTNVPEKLAYEVHFYELFSPHQPGA